MIIHSKSSKIQNYLSTKLFSSGMMIDMESVM